MDTHGSLRKKGRNHAYIGIFMCFMVLNNFMKNLIREIDSGNEMKRKALLKSLEVMSS